MKLYKIETGDFKLDGGAMFGVVPKVLWNKVYPADENNQISMSMRCLLIDTGDRKILIDNGIGNKQDEKFMGHFGLFGDHSLEKSLAQHGFKPEDITDMFLTHLHFDHCGGSIKYNENKELVTTFPNATYHISEQQWNWAINPNPREKASFLKENILPIKDSGQLQLYKNEQELFPGIYVRFFNGHTEGQTIPFIDYNGKTIVFTGDMLALAAHLPLPWVMSYDVRPLVTLEEKAPFLKEAVEKDYVLFFEHDYYNECVTLQQTEKGARMKDSFKFENL